MYTENNTNIELWLTMMQGQQSLTLRWRSFSRWGRVHVAFSFSSKGSQYIVYDCLQPGALQITQDTRPTFVEALLTLVSKMAQGGYWSLF